MPEKTREVVLTAKVEVPASMSDALVADLVQRLVAAGEEDAENAPPDWHDPDLKRIARMGVVRISLNHPRQEEPIS